MRKTKIILLSLFIIGLSACNSEQAIMHEAEDYLIIPQPNELRPGIGYFQVDENTSLGFDQNKEDINPTANYLKDWMALKGLAQLKEETEAGQANIQLKINEELSPSAYQLVITQKGVLLQGGDGAGLFHGVQSLIQLLHQQAGGEVLELPCVQIDDAPTFAYRGLHLDVGRHFFPVDFIKKYIDLLARYKMNRFHWHLTEDQGWRIEIKKYPKLQEIAAFRNETLIGHYNDSPQQYDGERYGGFYTQEEVKEVVQYAQERFITIIPEIEMPGHAQAALAAYPELSCAGGDIQVATKWGVFDEVYCPTDATFEFLENVLLEVMELFPSEYIHIGGDECPKTKWKESAFCQDLIRRENLKDEHGLQSYFIQRIEKFLNSKGRQIIGWDEILEGGLAPNATVMSWRGEEGGIEAAKQGHDVIMSPTSHCYLDYYQLQHPEEPLAIGGYLPLSKVYNYHPVPEELSDEEAKHILGVQGNLWTEYIKTPAKAEYMAFPRGIALAEVGWTQESNKDLDGFLKRIATHLNWLNSDRVNAANPLHHVDAEVIKNEDGSLAVSFSNLAKGNIQYTIENDGAASELKVANGPVPMSESGIYTGQAYQDGKTIGRAASVRFDKHLACDASIQLENDPAPRYAAGGNAAIINGIEGSNERYGDKEWLGFEGTDFIALLDLKEEKTLKEISFRFFNGPGQWIYPPQVVRIFVGNSADQLNQIKEENVISGTDKIVPLSINLDGQEARFIKLEVPNYGVIPEGRQGGGNRAWLFIDEISLN